MFSTAPASPADCERWLIVRFTIRDPSLLWLERRIPLVCALETELLGYYCILTKNSLCLLPWHGPDLNICKIEFVGTQTQAILWAIEITSTTGHAPHPQVGRNEDSEPLPQVSQSLPRWLMMGHKMLHNHTSMPKRQIHHLYPACCLVRRRLLACWQSKAKQSSQASSKEPMLQRN